MPQPLAVTRSERDGKRRGARLESGQSSRLCDWVHLANTAKRLTHGLGLIQRRDRLADLVGSHTFVAANHQCVAFRIRKVVGDVALNLIIRNRERDGPAVSTVKVHLVARPSSIQL